MSRHVEPAPAGGSGGDVGHPQPVRGVGVELTLHQVRGRAGLGVAACGARPLAPAHAGQARLAHHPSHPLAAHRRALLGQLGLNARRPVAPPAVCMNRPHAGSKGFVAALSCRTPSLTPRIEPARAWGGSGHTGHRGDAQLGLIRSHEPVDLPGPTSRANQAFVGRRVHWTLRGSSSPFASICLPSADKKIAIPVLHAHDGSHGAAGVSPRALRCSIHQRAGPRHARPARPSCGSPGRWVRTVYLRQTTTPPFPSQLFRSPSGANQLDHLAPEGRRVRRSRFRHGGYLLPKGSGVHEIGSTPRLSSMSLWTTVARWWRIRHDRTSRCIALHLWETMMETIFCKRRISM